MSAALVAEHEKKTKPKRWWCLVTHGLYLDRCVQRKHYDFF